MLSSHARRCRDGKVNRQRGADSPPTGGLEPADIDPQTGYRRYATGQIPAAQVIRRFRDLGMPLEQIQAVLAAPDLAARNEQIFAHLSRLEDELGRTQSAVSSLRDLRPRSASCAPS